MNSVKLILASILLATVIEGACIKSYKLEAGELSSIVEIFGTAFGSSGCKAAVETTTVAAVTTTTTAAAVKSKVKYSNLGKVAIPAARFILADKRVIDEGPIEKSVCKFFTEKDAISCTLLIEEDVSNKVLIVGAELGFAKVKDTTEVAALSKQYSNEAIVDAPVGFPAFEKTAESLLKPTIASSEAATVAPSTAVPATTVAAKTTAAATTVAAAKTTAAATTAPATTKAAATTAPATTKAAATTAAATTTAAPTVPQMTVVKIGNLGQFTVAKKRSIHKTKEPKTIDTTAITKNITDFFTKEGASTVNVTYTDDSAAAIARATAAKAATYLKMGAEVTWNSVKSSAELTAIYNKYISEVTTIAIPTGFKTFKKVTTVPEMSVSATTSAQMTTTVTYTDLGLIQPKSKKRLVITLKNAASIGEVIDTAATIKQITDFFVTSNGASKVNVSFAEPTVNDKDNKLIISAIVTWDKVKTKAEIEAVSQALFTAKITIPTAEYKITPTKDTTTYAFTLVTAAKPAGRMYNIF